MSGGGLTPDDVMVVFGVLHNSGLRPGVMGSDLQSASHVWAQMLRDVSRDELMTAAVAYVRGGAKWWPTVGQMLKQIRPDSDPNEWARAWHRVIKLIGERGRYEAPSHHALVEPASVRAERLGAPAAKRRKVDESTPLSPSQQARANAMCQGILACGGWVSICNATEKSLDFKSTQCFKPQYMAYMERYQRGQVMSTARQLASFNPSGQIERRQSPQLADFSAKGRK